MTALAKRQKFKRLLGFFFAGQGLRYFTQKAPTPENAVDLWYALPAFVVFLLFILGICSWAAYFRTRSKLNFFSGAEEALFDLSVGSVFAYVIAYALTPLGLFSAATASVLWMILAIGVGLGFEHLNVRSWFDFGKTWYSKLFMSLIPLIVLVKLIEGIQFHQHGDSYVTYLAGPRSWGESGGFQDFLKYSQLFLSTSWESLFAWGTALMGFRGGVGLDISQWFSQWVSALGVFGSLMVGIAFCGRLAQKFPLSSAWFPVISIASIQIPTFQWTQNLAKNDMGIGFWAMSAFYFAVFTLSISPVFAFFAGVLTGAAVVGKFTVVILGALITLMVFLSNRKNILPFVLGGLVGSLPVFLRNYILTDNPVFPWMPKVFPSKFLSDFAEHGASAAMAKSFQFADIPLYWNELTYHTPLLISFLVLVVWKRYRRSTLEMITVPAISYLIFTLTLRPSTGIRYQNASLLLLSLFSLYFGFFLLDQIAEKFLKGKKSFATGALAVYFLSVSNLTLFTLFQIGNGKKFCTFSKRMVNTNEIGGPAKVWIRSNIKPTETILSFGDVHIYYLLDYALTEVGQSVEWGRKVFRANLDEAEALFKHAPYDYLYLAGEDYYKDASFAADQAKIGDIMKRANSWDAKCKKFDNGKAQVWDLKCLN